MVEASQDFRRSSGSKPLLKQGHLKPAAQDHVQMASEYLQKGKLHYFPGQPVPALSQPHGKWVFPDVQTERPLFQFVLIASGPVTEHHRKEPGSIFFAPSLQVFIDFSKLPLSLLFSSLNSPSSFSFSPYEKYSIALIIVTALCMDGMSMSLMYWGAQHWTQHSRYVSPVLSRRVGTPPLTCWKCSA